MPRPRFERAAPAKREALLAAAAAEFAAHGYINASVNRILAKAGFSKGSFYYYFDDKADLAAAVVEHESAGYLASLEALGRPATAQGFWRAVHKLVELTETLQQERPRSMDALSRLGTAAARDPELLARMTGVALREASAQARSFWLHGQSVGAVRSDLPVDTLTALLLGFKTAMTHALLPHDRAPTREELDAFLRVYVDMVRRFTERRGHELGAKGRRRK